MTSSDILVKYVEQPFLNINICIYVWFLNRDKLVETSTEEYSVPLVWVRQLRNA